MTMMLHFPESYTLLNL